MAARKFGVVEPLYFLSYDHHSDKWLWTASGYWYHHSQSPTIKFSLSDLPHSPRFQRVSFRIFGKLWRRHRGWSLPSTASTTFGVNVFCALEMLKAIRLDHAGKWPKGNAHRDESQDCPLECAQPFLPLWWGTVLCSVSAPRHSCYNWNLAWSVCVWSWSVLVRLSAIAVIDLAQVVALVSTLLLLLWVNLFITWPAGINVGHKHSRYNRLNTHLTYHQRSSSVSHFALWRSSSNASTLYCTFYTPAHS